MCRSGNHAIIFWLMNNLGGYTNKMDGCVYWNPDTQVYFYNNCNHIKYNFAPHFNIMFKSFEDIYTHDPDMPDHHKIIIIRDFINLVSSRFRKYKNKLGLNWSYLQDLEPIIKLWKIQAKECLNNPSVIPILYNSWLTSKDYRDEISERLSIPNAVDNTSYVSVIGEGSSFCGKKLEQDKGSYLERFKSVDLPQEMKNKILADEELLELNLTLFGIDIKDIWS